MKVKITRNKTKIILHNRKHRNQSSRNNKKYRHISRNNTIHKSIKTSSIRVGLNPTFLKPFAVAKSNGATGDVLDSIMKPKKNDI